MEGVLHLLDVCFVWFALSSAFPTNIDAILPIFLTRVSLYESTWDS